MAPILLESIRMASTKKPAKQSPADRDVSEKPIQLNDLIPGRTVFGGRQSGSPKAPAARDKRRSK